MKKTVSVRLSEFSLTVLGEGGSGAAASLERAIRVYLNDKGSDNRGWPYPSALGVTRGEGDDLELLVDESLWKALEEEAAAQEVSASRLAGHAALYYAAERDAGRLTQRILDGLDDEAAE